MAGAECRVVLLVEDEVMVRNLIRQTLESAGFNVLSAANGLEALALSRVFKGRIDALLTDFDMPHLDGRAVIAAIRQDRPETLPILMSGGHGAKEFDDLNVRVLEKPFQIMKLVSLIEQEISIHPERPEH
jgi:CheY-like chemotaxis protein